MKTSELIGPALDCAVTKCEGIGHFCNWEGKPVFPKYSTNWALCGPIIDREGICFASIRNGFKIVGWRAAYKDVGEFGFDSPTTLISAMRCYVASKLGDEVEIPEELC